MADKKKKQKKEEPTLKKKIMTGLVLAVIAAEVILIFYFMFKGMRPMNSAQSHEAAQAGENAAESKTEEAVPTPVSSEEESVAEKTFEERTVNWHGKEMSLVPGTGNGEAAGSVLDYGEDSWWVEEGFVGQYTLTETVEGLEEVTEEFSELIIYENGNVVWITDDNVYSGELFLKRYYMDDAHGFVTTDSDNIPRAFNLDFIRIEDGKAVQYSAEEPVETQYVRIWCPEQQEPDPLEKIFVCLERVEE